MKNLCSISISSVAKVDIQRCIELGLVRMPAPVTLGYTQKGLPRKRRRETLTSTEYSRLRIQRLIASGLTARGTIPKRHPKAQSPKPRA